MAAVPSTSGMVCLAMLLAAVPSTGGKVCLATLDNNGGGLGFFLHNEMMLVRTLLSISKCVCVDSPLLVMGALELLQTSNRLP